MAIRFFLLAVFIYCCCLSCYAAKESKPYLEYVDQIIHMFENECVNEFKDFKLLPIGSGGGFAHDVNKVDVKFFAYKPATIVDAREIEVILTEKLQKKINDYEQIRPYLREYPFPVSRLGVSVSFHKRNGDYYTDGSVAHIFQARNDLVYSAADPKTDRLIDLFEEPYEVARKLVLKE